MEVQEVKKYQGVDGEEGTAVMTLTRDMLGAACLSPHTCDGEQECTTCELTTAFFQLAMDIGAYLCPRVAIQNNRVSSPVLCKVDLTNSNLLEFYESQADFKFSQVK